MANGTPSVSDIRTQVVVLICCYNGKHHLDELLPSLLASREEWLDVRVVVVDDHSPDGCSRHIEDRYPWVDCIRTPRNCGFAGANNYGWLHVRQCYPGTRYLVLLNQDTTVNGGWLTRLAQFLDKHPQAGAVQPKILLYDQPEFINTVGNRSHYLGFGLMTGYQEKDVGQYNAPTQYAYPSGCAVMLRLDILEELGLFDEIFYMYQEDVDLGWKLRQAGYQVWSVPESRVHHKYISKAWLSHYELLERNRWIMLLTYYRCWTMIALAPAIIIMEIGQLFFAARNNLVAKKLNGWRWFFDRNNLKYILNRRRRATSHRKIADRQLMEMHASVIHLPTGDPVALKWFGNPLCRLWWSMARHVL